jgi:hypothetical protein
MRTISMLEKTTKDGTLHLRIPLGKPETEFEVVVVVQEKPAVPVSTEERGWPPGYFENTWLPDDELTQDWLQQIQRYRAECDTADRARLNTTADQGKPEDLVGRVS